MRIDYTDWWNDIVALARANASILIAIAGAFVFLPMLASSFFVTAMPPMAENAAPGEAIAQYFDFYRVNLVPQLVMLLLSTLGQALLYTVLLDDRRPSVGAAFRLAAPLYVPLLLTNLLTNLAIGGGMLLLILPGLYLLGRLLLSAPALVAGRLGNPLEAIRRSWEMTRGQGWRIFFFAFLLFVVALVVQVAISGTLGLAVGLLPGADDPWSLRSLLLGALTAFFAALFFLLATCVWVALYRRLGGGSASNAV